MLFFSNLFLFISRSVSFTNVKAFCSTFKTSQKKYYEEKRLKKYFCVWFSLTHSLTLIFLSSPCIPVLFLLSLLRSISSVFYTYLSFCLCNPLPLLYLFILVKFGLSLFSLDKFLFCYLSVFLSFCLSVFLYFYLSIFLSFYLTCVSMFFILRVFFLLCLASKATVSQSVKKNWRLKNCCANIRSKTL
jgi:hypothetical protein